MMHLYGYICILYVLAVLDFGCCGFRTASGRSALLNKYNYFKNAVFTAILLGHLFLVVPMGALFFLLESAADKPQVVSDLEQAMQGMLCVYIPYTLLFLLAMSIRTIPLVDCKSLTSILLLGPLTFVRPMVAVIGIATAMTFSQHAEVFILGALAVFFVLAFELFMEYLHERRGRRRALPQS